MPCVNPTLNPNPPVLEIQMPPSFGNLQEIKAFIVILTVSNFQEAE